MAGRDNGCQCITDVMLASHLPLNPPNGLALMFHFKLGAIRLDQLRAPFSTLTKALAGSPATFGQGFLNCRHARGSHDQATRGYHSYQMMELSLDILETAKNIRMIKFKVI